jgi:four helix bundle protein
VIGKQILRSGTSVGAQYREACRAKSTPDFVSKLEGALQEAEETDYWCELLKESGIHSSERLDWIRKENNELIAMLVSMVKGVKKNRD